MADKRTGARPKRRQSVPGEIINILLNSPLGQSFDDKVRQVIGLPPREPSAKIRAEARGTADGIREKMKEPYKVLGVDPQAEEAVVKAAYKAKAKLFHRDIGGSDSKMAEINVAYERILEERGWKR